MIWKLLKFLLFGVLKWFKLWNFDKKDVQFFQVGRTQILHTSNWTNSEKPNFLSSKFFLPKNQVQTSQKQEILKFLNLEPTHILQNYQNFNLSNKIRPNTRHISEKPEFDSLKNIFRIFRLVPTLKVRRYNTATAHQTKKTDIIYKHSQFLCTVTRGKQQEYNTKPVIVIIWQKLSVQLIIATRPKMKYLVPFVLFFMQSGEIILIII